MTKTPKWLPDGSGIDPESLDGDTVVEYIHGLSRARHAVGPIIRVYADVTPPKPKPDPRVDVVARALAAECGSDTWQAWASNSRSVLAALDAMGADQKSALIRVVHDDVDTQRAQTPFLDEFVARGVNVHFEAMSNAQFWIGVDFDDGTKWSINCGAVNPNAKGYAFAEQDSP